jgi:p-cumate 2,3-dioxygenase ferredoxin subunit
MTNPLSLPDQALHTLCATADVQPGSIHPAQLANGHKLAIYCVDGEFFVTDDTCTHGEASLCEEGQLDGHEVECTWHMGRFDVRTGEACAMPCHEPLRSWPVRIVDGRVCVVDPSDPLPTAP